jgi:hypothetical protein
VARASLGDDADSKSAHVASHYPVLTLAEALL